MHNDKINATCEKLHPRLQHNALPSGGDIDELTLLDKRRRLQKTLDLQYHHAGAGIDESNVRELRDVITAAICLGFLIGSPFLECRQRQAEIGGERTDQRSDNLLKKTYTGAAA